MSRMSYICVQRAPRAAVNLAMEDWREHFDVVEFEEQTYELLDQRGFWKEINSRCDALIDIHEEEEIPKKHAPAIQGIANDYLERDTGEHPAVVSTLRGLVALARLAAERGAAILFAC